MCKHMFLKGWLDNSLAINFLYQRSGFEARWLSKILANQSTYWFARFALWKIIMLHVDKYKSVAENIYVNLIWDMRCLCMEVWCGTVETGVSAVHHPPECGLIVRLLGCTAWCSLFVEGAPGSLVSHSVWRLVLYWQKKLYVHLGTPEFSFSSAVILSPNVCKQLYIRKMVQMLAKKVLWSSWMSD